MKRTLILLLTLSLAFSALAASAAGPQVTAYQSADWAREELAKAAEANLIPKAMASQDLTRSVSRQDYAASAVLLYEHIAERRQLPLPEQPAGFHPFDDTQDPYVERACALGLVEGMGDRRFAPMGNLTREQAATILARLCTRAGISFDGISSRGFARITDADTISFWAREGAELMVNIGVIYGVGEGRFAPRNTLTGQECLIMNQRLAWVTESPAPSPGPDPQPGPGPLSGDAFNGALFAAVDSGEPNQSLSPVSLRYALGLLQPGAQGETRTQLDAMLEGVDFAAWNAALVTQGDGPTVEVANSIWFDTSVTPDPDYLTALDRDFQARSEILDLDTRAAMELINGWVKEKTHDLIPSLLGEPLDENAAAVLINALYFKGEWYDPFDAEYTYEQDFRNAGGGTVQVPFMHETSHFMTYFTAGNCTGVSLPYSGEGDWQMLFLLPKEGIDPKTLASQDFAALLEGAQESYVRLSLPKFTLEGSYDLTGPLQTMGLTGAFRPTGDLTPMGTCAKGPLSIDQVIQKTYLRVDEKGTEAAAVTGMITAGAALETEQPIPMTFDRPFLCCLWNGEIDQPLFLSVVEELG